MGLSHTESYGDFSRKSQKFSHPFYFASPLKGFPLELDTGAGRQKLECCNGADEEIFTIFSRLDRMHERNRQMNRRTAGPQQLKTALTHSVAR